MSSSDSSSSSSSDSSSDSDAKGRKKGKKRQRHHRKSKKLESSKRWKHMDSKIDKLSLVVEKLVESNRVSCMRSRSPRRPASRSRSPARRRGSRSPSRRRSLSRSSSRLDIGQHYKSDDFDPPGTSCVPNSPNRLHSGKEGDGENPEPRSGSKAAVLPKQVGSLSEREKSAPPDLDDEVLCLLGESRKEIVPEGPPLHEELARRWNSIASNGLSAEEMTKLRAKYPPPSNCTALFGPSLNPEVKAALSTFTLQRDNEIQLFQAQLGIGVTALATSLSTMFTIKEKLEQAGISSTELIGPLSDAGRGLLGLQHSLSSLRRTVIAPNIKSNLKPLVQNSSIDKFLFGNDLPQQIKTMQELNKAGQDIRQSATFSKSKRAQAAGKATKTSSRKEYPSRSAPLNFTRPSGHRRPQKTSALETRGGRYNQNKNKPQR